MTWHARVGVPPQQDFRRILHRRRSENRVPAVAQPSSGLSSAPPQAPAPVCDTGDDDVQLALASLFGIVPPALPVPGVHHRPVPLVNVATMCWMHAAIQARSGLPISSKYPIQGSELDCARSLASWTTTRWTTQWLGILHV